MMSRAIRLMRRLLAGERGFSLPEMLVAIALTSVVMTMLVSLVISFTRTFTEQRSLSDSINVAGVGMNEATRVIRAGTIIERNAGDLPVFVAATAESVVLHSYLAEDSVDPAPQLIELTVDSQRQLVEKRWKGGRDTNREWVFPNRVTATPEMNRVVARKLLAPTAAELAAGELRLFTYIDVDGSVIPAPVASSRLGSIATVKVTMIVQADQTGRANPVKLQNRVGIPNLTASRLGLEG